MTYRHVWPGVVLLASLALLLAGLLIWGDHLLSPGPSGGLSRLLQHWSASRAPQGLRPIDPRAARPTAGGAPPSPEVSAGADRVIDPPRDRPPAVALDAAAQRAVTANRSAGAPPRRDVRWALDLGTFPAVEEAERAEAQLNQAGFSTVRFRPQQPARLFSVYLPLPVADDEGMVLVARLHEDGFAQAVILTRANGSVIRIIHAMPLRTAVRIAERLRAGGHEPRVSAEAVRGGQVALRHGNFSSREEAESVGRELSRLGIAAEVVRIN